MEVSSKKDETWWWSTLLISCSLSIRMINAEFIKGDSWSHHAPPAKPTLTLLPKTGVLNPEMIQINFTSAMLRSRISSIVTIRIDYY